MRRFDGHGASSYRPTNPEAAKEQSAALRALLAERERQDAGLFGSGAVQTNQTDVVQTTSNQKESNQKDVVQTTSSQKDVVQTTSNQKETAPEETGPTYSLSDAGY